MATPKIAVRRPRHPTQRQPPTCCPNKVRRSCAHNLHHRAAPKQVAAEVDNNDKVLVSGGERASRLVHAFKAIFAVWVSCSLHLPHQLLRPPRYQALLTNTQLQLSSQIHMDWQHQPPGLQPMQQPQQQSQLPREIAMDSMASLTCTSRSTFCAFPKRVKLPHNPTFSGGHRVTNDLGLAFHKEDPAATHQHRKPRRSVRP